MVLSRLRETLVIFRIRVMIKEIILYVHCRDRELSLEVWEFLERLLSREGLWYLCKDDEPFIVERFGEDYACGRDTCPSACACGFNQYTASLMGSTHRRRFYCKTILGFVRRNCKGPSPGVWMILWSLSQRARLHLPPYPVILLKFGIFLILWRIGRCPFWGGFCYMFPDWTWYKTGDFCEAISRFRGIYFFYSIQVIICRPSKQVRKNGFNAYHPIIIFWLKCRYRSDKRFVSLEKNRNLRHLYRVAVLLLDLVYFDRLGFGTSILPGQE